MVVIDLAAAIGEGNAGVCAVAREEVAAAPDATAMEDGCLIGFAGTAAVDATSAPPPPDALMERAAWDQAAWERALGRGIPHLSIVSLASALLPIRNSSCALMTGSRASADDGREDGGISVRRGGVSESREDVIDEPR